MKKIQSKFTKSFKNILLLRSFPVRIYVVAGLFFVVINLLTVRFYRFQVANYDYWKNKALAQQFYSLNLGPERGEILARDKDGNLHHLAVNKHIYNLAVSPKDIEIDPEQAADFLAGQLNLPYEEVLKKLQKKDDPYELIAKNISEETIAAIQERGFKGLIIEDEKSRYYPLGDFASHIIGFVGFDDKNEIAGRYGLELGFNEKLSGSGPSAEEISQTIQKGSFLGLNNIYIKNGDDLVLTIEPIIQKETERLLKEEVEKWSAKSGNAIVVDPKTGEIIALANYPSFDPNYYPQEKDLSVFLNSAVSLRYEPGSVFKPFTLAAGLSSGKITPETTYFDGGEIKIDGRIIRNAGNSAPNKYVSMALFLQRSYNLGAVFIQTAIGNTFFRDFIINRLGFEGKTGIDLPQEINSSFSNFYPPEGRSINFATASFGQGVAVTPIKFIQEFAAFANNGLMMKPFVVKEIKKDNGKIIVTEPTPIRQTISPGVIAQAIPLLESVISGEHGSGKLAQIKGYRIAGKTGTGEIPREDGRGYSDQVNHSFAGFGPVSEPRFVILTRIEDPKGVRYAEATAVPLFRKIMKFVLDYYAIPPDAPEELN
ncbi:MAG: penicillin-binding protein 2 [Patescibacteria group bacterium]